MKRFPIYGALVEYAAPDKNTWLIGEDIKKSGSCSITIYEQP
jgi:Zn-dependent metalloprotease